MESCRECGRAATVREVVPTGDGAETRWLCDEHSSVKVPPLAPPDPDAVDEEIRDMVLALNGIPGVRTLCSCSGVHPGAALAYVEIRPAAEDPATRAAFDKLVRALVAAPDLRALFLEAGRPGGGVHLQVIDRANAAAAWSALVAFLRARSAGG